MRRTWLLLLMAWLLMLVSISFTGWPVHSIAWAAPDNLLVNAGFEDGSFALDALPTSWSKYQYNPGRAQFTWDNTVAHSGNKSVKISATQLDDARWLQVQSSSNAFLGRGEKMVGTTDWRYFRLVFTSGDATQVTVAARLSDYGGTTTGTAWFDDLALTLVTTTPAIVPNTPAIVPNGLLAPVPPQSDINFARTLAASGDVLVAGAPDQTGNQGPAQGAIYLLARNQGGADAWGQQAVLTAPDGMANDHFGAAIAINTDTLVVGAPQVTIDGKTNQGAVYIFARQPGNPDQWIFLQKLGAPDGVAGDFFGQALGLAGNELVIGAAGKAYLFAFGVSDPTQWGLRKRLLPLDTPPVHFGAAVAVQGDVALVGAPDESGSGQLGAAYLFQQNQGGANQWDQAKKFTPAADPPHVSFGSAVLLAGEQAFVGDPNPREVAIFARQQGGTDNWGQVQTLNPDIPITYPSRDFGRTLVMDDAHLLVSAFAQVYVFARDQGQDGVWQPARKLVLTDGSEFSPGLAARAQWVFVGANQLWQTGVYLFDYTRAPSPVIGFASTNYQVKESDGAAVITVTLDRPNPYPSVSINYATYSQGVGEATIPDDYMPVSGTLVFAPNAVSATFSVPIANDNLLERPESIGLELKPGVNAIPGQFFATLHIQDDDQAVCDYIAHDEASLDRAIRCANVAGAGVHTIQVTDNVSLTQPSTLLLNPEAAQIIIAGNGHTIDAQGHGRVIALYKSKVVMHDLTLRGGRLRQVQDWPNPNSGGGIYANTPNIGFATESSCALTLTNVLLTDNEAYEGGGLYYGCELPLTLRNTTISNNRAVYGGAFSTAGGEEFFTQVFVNDSTFSGNEAINDGGAFDLSIGDGGIILQLVNSTVSGNKATGNGGGLLIRQSSHDGIAEAQVINSTIANNRATAGSGVYNLYGVLDMSNSIIADNRGGSDCVLFTSEDGNGQLISHGHNLDSDGACLPAGVRQPGDIPGGKAILGPLADNGGPTLTHALLEGSQALEAADNAVCVAAPVNGVDQRGVDRPQGAHCDIGAFEAAAQSTDNLLFVSSRSSGRAGGVSFRDEDIVAYNFTTNSWQMVFDGSDVGVTKDVDAFAFLPNGDLLLSFNAPTDVPGLGKVDDSDIVRFIPTELGDHTAGTFSWYLRGADVGLTTDGEDIDAIGFTPDGHLVVSTIGDFNTPTASGHDEDLFQLDNATFGNPSSGAWRLYLDGAESGLANEDVNGLWIDPAKPDLYLTVKDSFAFDNQLVAGNDIFVCTLGEASICTYRLFWRGNQHGDSAKHLDGIGMGPLPPTFNPTVQAGTSAQAGASAQAPDADTASDDDADDLDVLEGNSNSLFLPLINR